MQFLTQILFLLFSFQEKIANIQQNKENESSSTSEQITLRPIGPGQGSFSSQVIQGNQDKHPSDPRFNQDYHGNQNVNIQSSNKTSHAQGPYRKIPKQETNFSNFYNQQPAEVTYYPGQARQGLHGELMWNFQNNNLQQGGYYGNQENVTNVKTNQIDRNIPQVIPVKKIFEKGKNKRKSHSDDSLDELIESNIQYLESEMESGKLKKISASQPRMFPTQQSDIYNKFEKRRSSSLDSSKDHGESSFQNEVKLRLQIPSSKEMQYDNRSIQSSQYDRLSHSTSESSTPPSAYTLPPTQEYIFQNTVPKVERKFQSATHSPFLPRRSTELSYMEDMSKSDSQLNRGEFGLDYTRKGNNPNYYPVQIPNYYPSQIQPQSHQIPLEMSSSAPLVEGGMFSDVDYDIEVTDRIKKWEKFMKKKTTPPASNESKSPVALTTIMESEGGIPDTWTAKPTPSVTVSSISVTVTKSVAHQPQPIRQQAWAPVRLESKVQSAETNSHRMFRVVQQPKIEPDNIFSTENIQKRAKVIRRSSSKESDGSQGHGEVLEESSTKIWPPTPKNLEVEDLKQARLSRFEEELTELQEIKTESVKDLRKRFDSDASGNESADITTENATPVISTPLRQRRQLKLNNNNAKNISIQKPIKIEQVSSSCIQPTPKMTTKEVTKESVQKCQNNDVWSPKLESEQGLISIERVKARTLQTIPFHEDPFWKQIEQMTSFDDLLAAQTVDDMSQSCIVSIANNPAFEFPPSSQIFSAQNSQPSYSCSSYAPTIITSTRPVQTSSTTVQPKPKVFHTPTIQPLKLAVAAKSSIEALDEVLDDIRLSLQKKSSASQQSYTVESSASSSVQSPSVPKNVIRSIPVEKLKQNNKNIKVEQNVSQKYFDKQKNMMSSSVNKKSGQNTEWIYPSFQQEAHSQMKNQARTNQQSVNQAHPCQQNKNQAHSSQLIKNQAHHGQTTLNAKPSTSQKSSQPTYIWKGNQLFQSTQIPPQNEKTNQHSAQFSYSQDKQQIPINPDITQLPYIINGNYQLDPSVLKDKLMNTGLAFDTHSETDDSLSQKSVASVNYADTERQFNQSIEDLQNLARDVEDKLSQIKCKIVDADENRLDSILSALRKFAPSEPVKTPPNIHTKEEQDRQRAKLNEALTELDRIYYGLHLDDPKVIQQSQKSDLMSQSQTLPSSRNVNHLSSPQMRRNKSDSGFRHYYQEETVAQVEQQTQKEFDDITKSFQTLLDEVSKDDTPASAKPSRHAAEIETTIESFLDEFRKSSDNTAGQQRNINEKFESKLKDAKMATKPNTCKDIQKSEVFTVSSGSFSALVGVKNKKNENTQQRYSFKGTQTNSVARYNKPVEVKSRVTSVPKVISSTAKIKLVSPVREIKVIKTSGSESEDISSDNHIVHKAKRNVNLQHRKSMPACMIQRTVETQTVEPSSPVSVIRRQFQSQDRQSREGSVSSESSAESKRARRKTISKGIALLMEFFSSSEDDSSQRSRHSTSAPDLRFIGYEKMTKSPSDHEKLKSKSRHLKQKHSSKSKKRSSYYKFDNVDDKVEDIYVTSTTSDDNVPATHGSKPPRHPKRKQSATSPEIVEDASHENSKLSSTLSQESHRSESNNVDTDIIVVRRKKCSNEEEKERPHSFHDLLATFETNHTNLKKLRKCSSAEAMLQEITVLNKSFHSDPDLRKDSTEDSGKSTGAKLDLEIKIKDTAV